MNEPEKYVLLIQDLYAGRNKAILRKKGKTKEFAVIVGIEQVLSLSTYEYLLASQINYLADSSFVRHFLSGVKLLFLKPTFGLSLEDLKKSENLFEKWRRLLKDHGTNVGQTTTKYMCIGMSDEKLKLSGVESK